MKKKILMVLMGLDIGGAETHVVELSKELRRRGHDVLVLSNGGVYERELTAEGIRCFHAPLHQRNVRLMLRSLWTLRRVIRAEKPDIVHAHARIPAFLCGLLHRTMHFPFVTSAHAVFAVNGMLRRLSDWGERTVAVSEDIRAYLQKNYGLPPGQIVTTINGIDTEKFSPEVSAGAVLREFSLAADRPTLVHVSRLDAETTQVTRLLLALAPQLRREIPGLQILIAGGGDVFEELAAQAESINRAAQERFVVLTGARTDINAILAAGTVFVGVSRAALEAMAAGKTVILAGSEGYIGLFDEQHLQPARDTNFCCRGCGMAEERTLREALLHAFALPPEQRAALGRLGRELVEREYSVGRMADDNEAVYRSVLAGHTRVVASGYYGFCNLGDDAILLALRDRMEALAPGARLIALSNAPRQTRGRCNVGAVYRFNPFSVCREIRRCTLFLSGGGSLLQDSTSTRSLLYYTALIRFARRCGKPILFYANGIGPVRDPRNRQRVRAAAEMADAITLRDEASYRELRAMGVEKERVFVTADPVYAMAAAAPADGRERLRRCAVPLDRPLVGVSVRFARGMEPNAAEFARFCDALAARASVVFLGMQDPQDTAVCERIRAQMSQPAYLVKAPYDPQGMMGMLACMDAVVSTRLHSIIFAACELVPVLGVVYDPKVEACLAELDMPSAGTLAGFDASHALAALEEVLAHREDYVQRLRMRVALLRQRAAENDRCLAELLGLS